MRALLDAAAEAGIDDPRVVATILAVALPRIGYLSVMVENLNSASADRIRAIWPWITQDDSWRGLSTGRKHWPTASMPTDLVIASPVTAGAIVVAAS